MKTSAGFTAAASVIFATTSIPSVRGFLVGTTGPLRSWGRVAGSSAAAHRQQGAAATSSLSMVSTTFGEKVNTDTIVMDKTAREALQEQYPEALANCPSFLETVGHGESRTFTEDELRNRLEIGRVFVKMANLILLSRGMNILAEDFVYFSPSTGKLDRESFLRLTKTIDVAFSTFRINPTNFVAHKDGTVSYRRTFRAEHDGFLIVGEKTYAPSRTKIVSDVDLCTVSFDDTGLLKSYSDGLMVEVLYAIEDPEAVAEIEAIKKRVINQEAKMVSLAGQESSIAYSKSKADIEAMGLDMEVLLEKVNSAPNTKGLGGIPGIFAAVGAEFPKDLTNLEGSDAVGEIETPQLASFSFPAEVKDYNAFDEDIFTEMT